MMMLELCSEMKFIGGPFGIKIQDQALNECFET